MHSQESEMQSNARFKARKRGYWEWRRQISEQSKVAFTPKWHIARGMWLENKSKETNVTCHTRVVWHIACATGHLDATPR